MLCSLVRLCSPFLTYRSCLSGIVAIVLFQPKSWIPFSVFIGGNVILIPLSIWFYQFTSKKFKQEKPDVGRVRLIDPEAVQDNYQTYSAYTRQNHTVN